MNTEEILTRGVAEILPSKETLQKLLSKRKIKLYLGIDPTGAKLHLGHSIALRKLQQFADEGHEAILLFGTGTVLAGDPSERQTAREKIAASQIQNNIATWKEQVKGIIDFNKVTIMHNAEWLLSLTLKNIIDIASNISATQLFKRDMFRKRIEKGDTVWTHELLYPLLQGYDSVAMNVDLEIGGTDQTFNMLIGRELQKKINNKEKFVLTVPMILGTDGRQMSKTSGNCIWLNDTPDDMFGKLLSIPDKQIASYLELVTNMPHDRVSEIKSGLESGTIEPLEAKKELTLTIVTEFHGKEEALKAEKNFEKTFQSDKPDFKKEVENKGKLVAIIAQEVRSNSKAKRLITQKAVDVDGVVITDPTFKVSGGEKIQIGKKIFIKVKK